jgi:transcription elongation factor Elf1
MKCPKCRKEKDETEFKAKNNRIVKHCSACREMCKKWRAKNKERVKLYNKFSRDKTENDNLNWETIKKENEITDNVKGVPSQHRVLHETVNEIIGKKCCTCKEWKPLTNYNKSKTHWDKLRNDCKDCLVSWRKRNRKQIQKTMTKYERERKKRDPAFKLVKTMRSRLLSALTRKNAKKNYRTMDLIGESPSFVMGYLEAKFTEGMTWENHGEWHIDHIKPCCSFDLTKEEEQIKCFHYSNLQPLWAEENLKKGGKYIKSL